MYTGYVPAKRRRSQDNAKYDKALIERCRGWYSAWEATGVFTPEERISMWFKIAKENGIGV